jgi:hypothetical protein
MITTFKPKDSGDVNDLWSQFRKKYYFVRRCSKCKGVIHGDIKDTADHYCICNIQSTTNTKIG